MRFCPFPRTLISAPSVHARYSQVTHNFPNINSTTTLSSYRFRYQAKPISYQTPPSRRRFRFSSYPLGRLFMSTEAASTDIAALEAEIISQTAVFNELRLSGKPVDEAKKGLAELKKRLALAKNAGKSKEKKGDEKDALQETKKKEPLLLKTAKGTRDYGPTEMYLRYHIESIIKDCFTTYGGACLDTPVFERKDILTDKYGEDSKLIFDLMDQGGEQLALRYDHTVPLARYLAMLGGIVPQNKIWQIGKVYRRDNPVMSKGRMREFMQADFDITGTWDSMIPDAELLSLLSTILTKLDVGEFTIKINHRKLLDGIFEVCGVPAEKIRSISSAVDKLDKLPWAMVKEEMTDQKGLDPSIADKIGDYVKLKGGPELLSLLQSDSLLTSHQQANEGLSDMATLFNLLRAYGILDKISFDLSLARGLDYYTGIIYEAIVEASAPPGFKADPNAGVAVSNTDRPVPAVPASSKEKKGKKRSEDEEEVDESQVGIGSIAAGGRYDNLVGAFLAGSVSSDPKSKEYKKALGNSVPCVGVSIGMDRIFALVWQRYLEKGARAKDTMVFVMSAGDSLLEERVGLVTELREAGVKADFLAKVRPKIHVQFAAGERDEVPFAVILGAEELEAGLVTVKEQRWEDGEKVKLDKGAKGIQVKRSELVQWLKQSETWKKCENAKLW